MIVLRKNSDNSELLSWKTMPTGRVRLDEYKVSIHNPTVGSTIPLGEEDTATFFEEPDPVLPDTRTLEEVKTGKIARAWDEFERRLYDGQIYVETSVGVHPYGTDAVTQDNIMKASMGVLIGATPNPRPWTPKGALAPISLSHDDIKTVASELGNMYDSMMQVYLTHKFAISALTTNEEVDNYDIEANWPM